jgi:hypothetical protein
LLGLDQAETTSLAGALLRPVLRGRVIRRFAAVSEVALTGQISITGGEGDGNRAEQNAVVRDGRQGGAEGDGQVCGTPRTITPMRSSRPGAFCVA